MFINLIKFLIITIYVNALLKLGLSVLLTSLILIRCISTNLTIVTNLDIQNIMELSAQMDVWQVWSSGRVVACHTRGTSTSGSNPTGGFILYSKKMP